MASRVPDSVTGAFVWEGESYDLKPWNTLELLFIYSFKYYKICPIDLALMQSAIGHF
ncbi:hypothetical protein BC643_3466 [Mangrovibacterium diazotrophicum]|uniref:Uncharacterized protein n=1 Tax=Mangrovibacterium diazotrophicum TaxID=1261403 RepID=A0A419VYM1_9BACT|nr:hypothetical protein BC643_3466 [Mangrovibacterium diazotrophicum]